MTRSTGQLTCLLQRTNWLDAIFVIGCVFLYECGGEKTWTNEHMYTLYEFSFHVQGHGTSTLCCVACVNLSCL